MSPTNRSRICYETQLYCFYTRTNKINVSKKINKSHSVFYVTVHVAIWGHELKSLVLETLFFCNVSWWAAKRTLNIPTFGVEILKLERQK